jgi:hypothetical protein
MRRFTSRGFSVIALLIGGLLVGGAGIAAVKIGIPYADAKVLKGIIDNVLVESKTEGATTNYEVAKKIFDRSNVQTLNLDFEGIHVKTMNAGEFSVHVDMVTKIQLWKQAKLILEIPVDAQTK